MKENELTRYEVANIGASILGGYWGGGGYFVVEPFVAVLKCKDNSKEAPGFDFGQFCKNAPAGGHAGLFERTSDAFSHTWP